MESISPNKKNVKTDKDIGILTWNPNSLKVNKNEFGNFYFKSFFKINKLLKRNTLIAIQEAKLNLATYFMLKKKYTILSSNFEDGLIILVPQSYTIIEHEIHKSKRIQAIVYVNDNKKYILLNNYGPPCSDSAKKFCHLHNIDSYLQELNERHPLSDIFIVGDLNIRIDTNKKLRIRMQAILNKYQLHDIYRTKHPNKETHPGFTRFPYKNQKGTPGRIDYCFASKTYTNFKISLAAADSDHRIMHIQTYKQKSQTKKKNLPNFAEVLLEIENHKENLAQIIKQENKKHNPEQNFDQIISNMINYSNSYTKDKLKNSNKMIQAKINITRKLEQNFHNLSAFERKKYYHEMSQLIELLRDKEKTISEFKGKQFQDYGQRGTRQYFNLVKAQAEEQIMREAKLDDKNTTTDPTKIADYIQNYYKVAFEKTVT